MYKVKITVVKLANYTDLQSLYENPILHTCDMQLGQEFTSVDATIPQGMCESAWQNLQQFVFALASGGGNFYDGWMKDKYSACISCNDGFRPVSFLLQRIDE